MKVGLLGNQNKIRSSQVIEEMSAFLRDNGHVVTVFNAYSEIDGVDVVLVLGGDGAILHSAVYAARKNIKIIGINYGTLGFLAEYERNEREKVKDLLSALVSFLLPLVCSSLSSIPYCLEVSSISLTNLFSFTVSINSARHITISPATAR